MIQYQTDLTTDLIDYDIPCVHRSHIKCPKWMSTMSGFLKSNEKKKKGKWKSIWVFDDNMCFPTFLPLNAHQFNTEIIYHRQYSSIITVCYHDFPPSCTLFFNIQQQQQQKNKTNKKKLLTLHKNSIFFILVLEAFELCDILICYITA